MSATKIPLELIKVASPCKAPWSAMAGDDKVRFCGQCSQHVYNLSEMSQAEAEALVMEREGKLCVRFYQRADGTMMTKDCPVGWAAVRRKVALAGWVAATVFVASLGVLTLGVFAAPRDRDVFHARFPEPIQSVWEWFFPQPTMGKPCPIPAPMPVPPAPLPQQVELQEEMP